ncbi:MAG: radical SAM/SPASM domain protein, ACGX system [Eggerthellaceae bacterium]|nr:radical SAM/SPASM domain protein, ACGX system [Eggerthellaceae bacterium]MBQ9069388.1 radical SAM/SPASM domain protein, ACGX system [Eggerthellaceae bacterium]
MEFAFQWHITDDCDQRCKHCYIYAEDGSKHVDTMSWEQIEATWANIRDFCATFKRTPHPYITGGDPILHPDFWRLMELMHDEGVTFTLMGNPFHLTDEVCARLKEAGCRKYQLSLDGMRETHDWFRKPGSFDATLDAIGTINRSGMKSVVMSTVSAENIDEIPDLIDAVVEREVGIFAFGRYVPSGGGLDAGVEPLRYRKLLDTCHKKYTAYRQAGCKTHFSRKDHLWALYDWEEGRFEIPEDAVPGKVYGGCNCGVCHLTITPAGQVLACRRVPDSPVGDIARDRLADIWTGPMEDYRDFTRFEKCAECEIMPWCRGCPAVAKGTNGSFYSPDPQCWKE